MPYVLLASSVLLSASSGICGKFFNRVTAGKKNANPLYSLILLSCVLAGWFILYLSNFSFEVRVLPYSLVFGASYVLCSMSNLYALKYGPVALTQLLVSFSNILAAIWGILFWGAELTVLVITGLVLVLIALTLCTFSGKKEKQTVSGKWLLFVLLAVLGNAGCIITQRTEQMVFDGRYGNMLMAFAMIPATVIALFLFLKGGRTETRAVLKKGWFLPVIAGVANIVLNLFVMMLVKTELSPSLIYPVIGVGSFSVVLLFSQLVFKEKLRWWQWIGIAAGAAATVILSI